MRNLLTLLIFLGLVAAAAWFGAQFEPGAWYDALNKPAWTPPAWLFGPVWTVLYVLIAVAAWLVWRAGTTPPRGPAITAWGVQLALNAIWSWLFFGLHRPGWAFAEIGLLWLAVAWTLIAFWRREPVAGWLMVPYLAWVSFAAALNYALWDLNGGGLL